MKSKIKLEGMYVDDLSSTELLEGGKTLKTLIAGKFNIPLDETSDQLKQRIHDECQKRKA